MARADDRSRWDGTYTHDSRSGDELCPYKSPDVVVKNGEFSIVWNVRAGDARPIQVGVIHGTVRPSGMVIVDAKVFNPMRADSRAVVEEMGDSVDELKKLAADFSIRFEARDIRTMSLSSPAACSGHWNGTAPTDKDAGTAKVITDAKVKPAPALAAGSSTWDAIYVHTGSYSTDWRCLKAVDKLTVKQGRFSIPWRLDARNGRGESFGEMVIGSLDGSIPATGKTKLRTWFSVNELPPEIAAGRTPAATLDTVRALAPTMTFATEGSSRKARLTFGDTCELLFAAMSAPSTAHVSSSGPLKKPATTAPKVSVPSKPSAPSKPSKPSAPSKPPPRPAGKKNGAECTLSSDCASHNCDDDRCSGTFDREYAEGMECEENNDCASEDCDQGECQ